MFYPNPIFDLSVRYFLFLFSVKGVVVVVDRHHIYVSVCGGVGKEGVFVIFVRSLVRWFVGGWGGGFRTIGWMVRC